MSRTNVSSGLAQDEAAGLSRAVRIGNIVKVGAVGPLDPEGKTIVSSDEDQTVAAQTVACFEAIGGALEAAGGALGDIVQTRILVTSRDDAEKALAIHGQLFAEVRPACTVTIVAELAQDDWQVQVEAEAILTGASA